MSVTLFVTQNLITSVQACMDKQKMALTIGLFFLFVCYFVCFFQATTHLTPSRDQYHNYNYTLQFKAQRSMHNNHFYKPHMGYSLVGWDTSIYTLVWVLQDYIYGATRASPCTWQSSLIAAGPVEQPVGSEHSTYSSVRLKQLSWPPVPL